MKLWAGLKRWYLRRFKGFVAAPARSGGTSWQQHGVKAVGYQCRCGNVHAFAESDLKIMSQDHVDGCDGIAMQNSPLKRCSCPISEARYVKICPGCGLGHWKQWEGNLPR